MLFLILLCTTFFSGYLFNRDVKKDTGNTSIFYKSLEGLKPFLKNKTQLNVQTDEPRVQHLLEARYILFPVQLHLLERDEADTTLYILKKEEGAMPVKGQVLWQNEDERFHYYLVKKQ